MKKRRIIIFILIIIWSVSIFALSGQDGDESSGLSRKIAEIFFQDKEYLDIAELYVRKLAHFSEYFIGGILFFCFFQTYDLSEKKKVIFSSVLGIWYSAFDEIHQYLVPGRLASIKDVYIDSLGIITGVLISLLIIKITKKYRNKEKRVCK